MNNAAAPAIRTLRTPLGESPLAELKTGDLLAIAEAEVIEPEDILMEPDIEGEAVGFIIDMLVMLDLLHPPTIPPILAPTYRSTLLVFS
jgi:hypothetical protein